jgi:hypothetical protein
VLVQRRCTVRQRRILLELHKHLFREPVTGPDGIAVALWYESAQGYRAPLIAPIRQWPGAPKDPLTAIAGHGVRMLNFLVSSPRLPFVVHAHAMFGPPAAVIRVFQSKNEAAAFAAELAQRVRASGVEALSQPPQRSG